MKSKKVAYLLGSLNRGGTETLLLDVFRNAVENNLDAIGLYRKDGILENEFLSTKLPFLFLPTSWNLVCYLITLRKILLNNKVKVAHAQQPIDALYAYLATAGTDIKVILTFHGYDMTEGRMGQSILNFIIHRTNANLYVSDSQKKYYTVKYKLDPVKQFTAYNGIDFKKLESNAVLNNISNTHISTFRKELSISSNTLLLGTVGNFNSVRDQFTLCRFLKLLKEQQIDFHFVFIGRRVENESNLYDDCINFCTDYNLQSCVTFLGGRSDVPSLLPQFDAFMYSTSHDTFGIAVVEAMAAGIPVFVNDWEVMVEITESGSLSTLYKTRDETDLLRHFLVFLQDITGYKMKANDTSEFVRKQYSIENHILKLKEIYNLLTPNS